MKAGWWEALLTLRDLAEAISIVLNKIRDKSITHNIFGIQDNESIFRGFYCITFIEYMLAGKPLFDYTNLFSPNDYTKNDKIIIYVF